MPGTSPKMLIVGLGETGVSVARFFHQRSIPFSIVDSRDAPPGYQEFTCLYPQVEVRLGDFDERFFLDADGIVVSPGVSLETPAIRSARAKRISVIGDIELFARVLAEGQARQKTVVAITGSNGKSTVTALVADMAARAGMKAVAGGNYSPPALDLIDLDVDCYVLELSSFQLELTCSLRPEASTVLNISEDHRDRYGSFADYVAAKQRVHRGSATVVLNREESHRFDADRSSRVVSFGLDAPDEGHFGVKKTPYGRSIAHGSESWIDCDELGHLPGDSGVLNAQAALALGSAVGVPEAEMIESLRTFQGLPHRFQVLGALDDVVWINDSKATNVAAATAALASVERPCVWIAGGDGKEADFGPLRAAMARVCTAVLFGKDSARIADVVSGLIDDVRIVGSLDEATREAYAASDEGDCVLLSPACASLDMFHDYKERGACFARAFQELCRG